MVLKEKGNMTFARYIQGFQPSFCFIKKIKAAFADQNK